MLLSSDQKFWTWCWYTFAKIRRGELWEALIGVHAIRCDAMLPMLDWKAGRRHEGHRRLEAKLDPEEEARLAATVASLQAEITLFHDLRGSLFETYGLAFDPEPEEGSRAR